MRWTITSVIFAVLLLAAGLFSLGVGDAALAVMDSTSPNPQVRQSAIRHSNSRGRVPDDPDGEPPAAVPAPVTQVPVTQAPVTQAPDDASPAQPFRLEIPVAWQMTKARLIGAGAATLTESFRENWTLEVRSDGLAFLESPRGRVSAYLAGKKRLAEGIPSVVVVTEKDFALLIGLPVAAGDDDEQESTDQGHLVSLNLAKNGKGGTDVTLSYSDEEHFAVHVEIGANPSTMF